MSVYKKDQLYKRFLPFNQAKSLGFCVIGGAISLPDITNKEGSIYISTPLDHSLYKITKDTATKIGEFIFPKERSVPRDIIFSDNVKRVDSVNRKLSDTKTIIDVSNIFFHKHNLFFKINPRAFISYPGSEGKNSYNFIYDTISKRIHSLERVMPDSLSFYLPFLGNSSQVTGFIKSDDYIFTSLSSLQMFTSMMKNQSPISQYPPVLQEYFKTQNRKSNPVIVKMKLKE